LIQKERESGRNRQRKGERSRQRKGVRTREKEMVNNVFLLIDSERKREWEKRKGVSDM
jgi:hypothetical protein